MQRAILRLFAIATITSLAGGACTLISEVDRSKIPAVDSEPPTPNNLGGESGSDGSGGANVGGADSGGEGGMTSLGGAAGSDE